MSPPREVEKESTPDIFAIAIVHSGFYFTHAQ